MSGFDYVQSALNALARADKTAEMTHPPAALTAYIGTAQVYALLAIVEALNDLGDGHDAHPVKR